MQPAARKGKRGIILNITAINNFRKIDVVVVTVIPAEERAVSAVLGLSGAPSLSISDSIEYRVAEIVNWKRPGEKIFVGHFHAGAPGNTYMSSLVTRICLEFQPALVVLVGIAAGVKRTQSAVSSSTKIGSIHLPKKVVDFSMTVLGIGENDRSEERHRIDTYDRGGKLDRQVGSVIPDDVLQVRKQYFPTAPGLDTSVMMKGLKFTRKEWQIFKDAHIELEARVDDKWLGSSNRLLRNPDKLLEWQKHHGDLVAADMESAGLIVACKATNTEWLVIRGVSDFGDKEKSDHFHNLASQNAAAFLKVFLDRNIELDAFFSAEAFEKDRNEKLRAALSQIRRRIEMAADCLRPFVGPKTNFQVYWIAQKKSSEGTWEDGVIRDPDLRIQRGEHSKLHATGYHPFSSKRLVVQPALTGRTVFGNIDHPLLKWVCATPISEQDGRSGNLLGVFACAGEEEWPSESGLEVTMERFAFALVPIATELARTILEYRLADLRLDIRRIE